MAKTPTMDLIKKNRISEEAPPEVRLIPLADITPSKTNPRLDYDKEALAGLAESIKTQGIALPLIVRPLPGGAPGKYELVAGERRLRAAKQAGLGTAPAIVRELSDHEAIEIQVVENAQRESLSALEEAQGFQELLRTHQRYTPQKIADQIGKSLRYVYNRLELAKLIDPARKALLAREISPSHAELLCRIPEKAQEEIWKRLMNRPSWNRNISVRDLKDLIDREVYRSLSAAPWKWEDVSLSKDAPPCTVCPKRAGNMDVPPEGTKPETCTDQACYRKKFEAWTAQKKKVLEGQGHKAAFIVDGHHTNRKDAVAMDRYRDAGKKTCPDLTFGIEVEGERPGRVKKVCMKKDCKIHNGGGAAFSGTRMKKTPQEIGRERKAREAAALDKETRETAARAILAKAKHPLPLEDLRAVTSFAFRRLWHENQKRAFEFLGWEKDEARINRKYAGTHYDFEKAADRRIAKARTADEISRLLFSFALVPLLDAPGRLDKGDRLKDIGARHKVTLDRVKRGILAERKKAETEQKKKTAGAAAKKRAHSKKG